MPARRASIALLAAAAVVAAPLLLAAPAAANGPAGTALLSPITRSAPNDELADLQTTATCETGAYSGQLHYENVSTGEVGLYVVSLDAGTAEGTFSEDPTNNMGDPGDEIDVWLECWSGPLTPTLLGTSEVQTIVLYDSGAAIDVPGIEVGGTFAFTGTCGTAAATEVQVFAVPEGMTGEEDLLFSVSVVPAGDGSFSFSGLAGPTSPGNVLVQFACLADSGDGLAPVTDFRGVIVEVRAKQLPGTGAETPTAPLAVGALALLAGTAALAGARIAAKRRG